MQVAAGKSILNGIAIGKVLIFHKQTARAELKSTLTPQAELERFQEAREKAQEQLRALYDKTLEELGEDNAAIFDIHRMILDDEDYTDAVQELIESQGATAEHAVSAAGDSFSQMFAAMDDEYMKARATDVQDISHRMADIFRGGGEKIVLGDEPVILVADDLTPSETVQLDRSKLLGFITRYGSPTSHTAILARTMNLPALIGVDFDESWNGKQAVLDGYGHCVYIDPSPELLASMEAKRQSGIAQRALLRDLTGKPNVTLDGREIDVCANIGSAEDVALALQNDAGGIGLFRSEFLYLRSRDYPTEEEQFAVYRRVAEAMGGQRVVIRTLDIGADKQADYFKLDREENPALGYRAIRICLTRRDVFKQQLRAILRAGAYGRVSVMFPMIISLQELKEAKAILEECRAELREEGAAMGEVELGVMIETPAAVMVTDELAEEVDFFSLGTNDLTQYTLAIDRQNPRLEPFYDPHHPAVLRMVHMTVEAGHRHGCRVGLCGELGADLSLTETFLRMGLDELSVSPSAVLPLRRQIRSLDLSGGESGGRGPRYEILHKDCPKKQLSDDEI